MATSKKKTPEGKSTDKPEKTTKASVSKQKAHVAAVKPEVKAKAAVTAKQHAPVKALPQTQAKAKPQAPAKTKTPAPTAKVKTSSKAPVKPVAKGAKTAPTPSPSLAPKDARKAKAAKPVPTAIVEKPAPARKGGKPAIKEAAVPVAKSDKSAKTAKPTKTSKRDNPSKTEKSAAKKPVVAVFTMDDVRDVLKNRREEAREQAEKKEAAARKAATNLVVPETMQTRVLGAATLADILGFGMPRQQEVKREEPANKRDVPEKYRKYYDTLINMRDKIQGKINQRGRVVKDTDTEASLAVPAQTDDDDTFDHEFALSLVANEQDALMEIDAALDRIYEGTYGICEITGQTISAERLDAVPFARFSVEGQAQFEMQNRRKAQRMTSFMDSADDATAFAGEETDE
jgi:RNA polymerase-binding transcription factor DksA